MRRLLIIALSGLLGLAAAACAPTSSPSDGQSPTTGPASTSTSQSRPPPPAAPTRAGHKPLIVGLVDKGSEAPYHRNEPYRVVDTRDIASRAAAFGGIVVNATWSQLEPREYAFDFATLDASLSAIAVYDRAHPDAPLGVRLRVFGAFAAPAWAKALDGAPITVAPTRSNPRGGTLGRWWDPQYRSAWSALQQALATRYDTNALLRDVAVTSCSTLTAEPFVISPRVIAEATSAGWTAAAQQACLDGAFSDYAPWKHTAIYYPMNPLAGDQRVTDEVMDRCVRSAPSGGPWCILANNALSPVSSTTGRSAATYAAHRCPPVRRPVGYTDRVADVLTRQRDLLRGDRRRGPIPRPIGRALARDGSAGWLHRGTHRDACCVEPRAEVQHRARLRALTSSPSAWPALLRLAMTAPNDATAHRMEATSAFESVTFAPAPRCEGLQGAMAPA